MSIFSSLEAKKILQIEKPFVDEQQEEEQVVSQMTGSIFDRPEAQQILQPVEPEAIEEKEPSFFKKFAYGFRQEPLILGNINRYFEAGLRSRLLDESFDESLKQNEELRQQEILRDYPEFANRKEGAAATSGRLAAAFFDPVSWAIPWTKISKLGTLPVVATGATLAAGDVALREKVLYGEVNPLSVGLAAGLGAGATGVSQYLSSRFKPIKETFESVDENGNPISKQINIQGEPEGIPSPVEVKSLTDFMNREVPELNRTLGILVEEGQSVGILRNQVKSISDKIEELKELRDPLYKKQKNLTLKDLIKQSKTKLPTDRELNFRANFLKRQKEQVELENKIGNLHKQRNVLRNEIKGIDAKAYKTYGDTNANALIKAVNEGKISDTLIDKFIYEMTRPFFGGLAGGAIGAFVADDDQDGLFYTYIGMGVALGAFQKRIQSSDFTIAGGNKIKKKILETGDDLARRSLLSWSKAVFAGTNASKMATWGGETEKFIKRLTKSQGAALKTGEVAELSVEERKFLFAGKMKEYISKYVFQDEDVDTILAAGRLSQGDGFYLPEDLTNEAAKTLSIRILKFQKDLGKYVEDVGIDYKELENYGLTQLIDFTKVGQDRVGFEDAVKSAFKIQNQEEGRIFKSAAQEENFLNKQTESYIRGQGRLRSKSVFELSDSISPKDAKYAVENPKNFVVAAASHFEKDRVIYSQKARQQIKDFLVEDPRQTMNRLIDNTVPVVEFSRTFGSRGQGIIELFNEVERKYNPYRPRPNAKIKLEQKEIADIKNTVNSFFGKYGAESPINNSEFGRTFIGGLTLLTNATRLTKVALPSLGELLQPIQNSGFAASFKAAAGGVKKKLAQDGWKPSDALAIKYNNQLERELQGYTIDLDLTNNSQRAIAKLNQKFFEIVQLGRVTNWTREFAFDTGVYRAFDISKKITKDGVIKKSLQREIGAMGLTKNDLLYLKTFDNVKDAYKNTQGKNILDTAGFKVADRDALIPTIGNRRLFSQSKDPAVRLLGTFLSWAQAKTTQTNSLVSRIENGDVALAVRMMAALNIYGGILYLQRFLSPSEKYKEEFFDREPFDRKTLAETYALAGNLAWYLDKSQNVIAGPGARQPVESLYPVLGFVGDMAGVGQKTFTGQLDKAGIQAIETFIPFGRDMVNRIDYLKQIKTGEEESKQKKTLATGGLVEGPEVPFTKENPANRVDPFTGEPYQEQMSRLGFDRGGVSEDELLNFVLATEDINLYKDYKEGNLDKVIEAHEGSKRFQEQHGKKDKSTIGGITESNLKTATVGQTVDMVRKRLNEEKKYLDSIIPEEINNKLPQSVKNSAVSLMFNVGKDAFTNSNAYKNLSKGNIEGFYIEAFDPEQGFTKITGADNIKRVDEGLVNRRQQEKQLAEGTWQDPYASIY